MAQRISSATLKRIRDYAVEEPSYTISFAAWELGLSFATVSAANYELLRLGIVHKIERRSGPLAAVYAYRPIPGDSHSPRRRVGTAVPKRAAVPVPGTGKPIGPSGKPSPKRSARRPRRRS